MATHAPLDAAAGDGVAPPVPLTDAGVDAALRRAAKAREMAPRTRPEGPYDGETLVVLLADDVDGLAREVRRLRAELGQLHVLGCETIDERDRLRGIPRPVDLPDDLAALRAIVRGLDATIAEWRSVTGHYRPEDWRCTWEGRCERIGVRPDEDFEDALVRVMRERGEQDARIAALEAERNEARAWVRRLTAAERVLTCAFCGEAYPPGTPESNHAALTAHVRVCTKHPMRAAENAETVARASLDALQEAIRVWHEAPVDGARAAFEAMANLIPGGL